MTLFRNFLSVGFSICLPLTSQAISSVEPKTLSTKSENQAPEIHRAISLADEVANSTVAGEFEKVIEFIHPALVKMAGGKDKYLDYLKKKRKNAEESGIYFVGVKTGSPSFIYRKMNKYYIIIPTLYSVKTTKGKIQTHDFLFGISKDGGANWLFDDGEIHKDLAFLPRVFPDLPGEVLQALQAANAVNTEKQVITIDTDLEKTGSVYGEGRKVPEGITILKGVVPFRSEFSPKAYSFILAPKEAIRVRVIECNPQQVYLAQGELGNVFDPQELGWTPQVGFINKSGKPSQFWVLVMARNDQSQYTLAIERWKSQEISK